MMLPFVSLCPLCFKGQSRLNVPPFPPGIQGMNITKTTCTTSGWDIPHYIRGVTSTRLGREWAAKGQNNSLPYFSTSSGRAFSEYTSLSKPRGGESRERESSLTSPDCQAVRNLPAAWLPAWKTVTHGCLK